MQTYALPTVTTTTYVVTKPSAEWEDPRDKTMVSIRPQQYVHTKALI